MPTKPARLRAFAALLTALCLLVTFTTAQAQSSSVAVVPQLQTGSVGINTDGSTADASALLDVKSTTQGVLVPRMNAAQRGLVSTPATGLLVYQTDAPAGFYFHNGSATWADVAGATAVTYTATISKPVYYRSRLTSRISGYDQTTPGVYLNVHGCAGLQAMPADSVNTGALTTHPMQPDSKSL